MPEASLRAQSAPFAEITVGRKTGREVSLPVQFVYEDGRVFLLAFKGKVTNWYLNLVRNPTMKVSLSGDNTSRTCFVYGAKKA